MFYDTPTIWTVEGLTYYFRCDDRHYPKDDESQKHVKACKDRGEHVVIPTREAAVLMLEDVPAADVAAAHIDPAVLDVTDPDAETKKHTVVPEPEFEKVKEAAKKKVTSADA